MPTLNAGCTPSIWASIRRTIDESLAGASIATFLSRIAAVILGVVLSVLTARLLEPTGRGQYALLTLVPAFATTLLDPGFGSSAVYVIGRRLYPVERVSATLMLTVLPLSALVFGVVVVAASSGLIKGIGLGGVDHLLLLSASSVPFTLATGYLQQVLLGQRNFVSFNVLPLASVTVQILATGFLLVAGYGVTGAVLGAVIANAASFVIAWRVAGVRRSKDFRVDREYLQQAFSYGMRGYIGRVLPLFSYRLDMFLVGHFLGASAVGLYSIAVSISERLLLASGSVSTAVFSTVSSSSPADARRITAKACRITILIMAAGVMLVVALSQPVILLLFGKSYRTSSQALQLLAPGMLGLSIASILSSYFSGIGRPELGIIPSVASVVVNIAVNLLLIPRIGINGASIASLAAYMSSAAILLFYFLRMSGYRLRDIMVISRADVADIYARIQRWGIGPHAS